MDGLLRGGRGEGEGYTMKFYPLPKEKGHKQYYVVRPRTINTERQSEMNTERSEPPVHMQDRPHGSTNLIQCGWCDHASGSHRYNYCIDGKCRLRRSYDKDVQWDTICHLQDASKADIKALIEYHLYEIKSCEQTIVSHRKHIGTLSAKIKDASDRPVLPGDREHDHFNVGDPILLFYEISWITGEVKNGYRHHDGCVSYRLDGGFGPQGANDTAFPFEGGFWGCGYAVPIILLQSNAEWLMAHPEECKIWFDKACDQKFNGETMDRDKLCKSLLERVEGKETK